MAGATPRFVKFGIFELDLRAGELRKRGLKVKLQKQPVEILAMLLERRGEVVTRDELRERLWPADVFVDFDHSLNKAINKLREALGDSPDTPRYIETLPRRGYRFIAPVEEVFAEAEPQAGSGVREELQQMSAAAGGQQTATQAAAAGQPTAPQAAAGEQPTATQAAAGEPHALGRRMLLWTVAAVLIAAAGGWLYFSWRGTSQPSSGGIRTVPLTSLPGREVQPAFSPDGRQAAFAWKAENSEDFDIYIRLVGAGPPLRLTSDAADDLSPAWSPDGRYIAFIRQQSDRQGIFLVSALGGSERKIGEAGGLPFFGRGLDWSPDGKYLAIIDKQGPQGPFCIFLLSVDTSQARKLSSPPAQAVGDSQPAFSPDGKFVAFSRTGSNNVDDIYVLPVGGGAERRITFDNRPVSGLSWMPDGKQIVFASDRGGALLWRVASSGGPPEPLAVVGLNPGDPAVCRIGRRLAYTQWTIDTNIWRFEASGAGGAVQHARPAPPAKWIFSSRRDDSPQFAPDGNKIAFASDRSGSYEIWVCDRDGNNQVRLTYFDGPLTGTPRWSPDGRQVAFDSRPAGQADIFVVDARAGSPRRLTSESSEDVVPSWSADGRWVYFASNRSGDFQVWKTSAAGGGAAVQVTRKGGFEAFESPDGAFVYYSKTRGVAGIWRAPAGGGEEAPVPELARAGYWRYWMVARQGLYFVPEQITPAATVCLFDCSTRRVTRVATFQKAPIPWTPGLGVSPDGRWLLYAQEDQRESDITMVENFR